MDLKSKQLFLLRPYSIFYIGSRDNKRFLMTDHLKALGGRLSGLRLLDAPNSVLVSSLGVNGRFVRRDLREVRASLMISVLSGAFLGGS